MKYITASGLQTLSAGANGLLLQVNTALTAEAIELATANGRTFAVINGPVAAGAEFRYVGLRGLGAITIEPNATVDITVSFLNRQV